MGLALLYFSKNHHRNERLDLLSFPLERETGCEPATLSLGS